MKVAAWVVVLAGSIQAGENVWTRLGPESAAVASIAIDPQNPATVYAATRIGLFRSVDEGVTWAALNPGTPCCASTLVINTQDSFTIYAVSRGSGVFRSTDGGTNWNAVNSGLPADDGGNYAVTSLAMDPQTPNTLYAGSALVGGSGVFKSIDGGASWNSVSSGLPDGGVNALAINPQDTGTIFAIVRGDVYQSTDGAASWSRSNITCGCDFGFTTLAIGPQNPDTVYAAGEDAGVWKSTDAGASWTATRSGPVITLAIDWQGAVYAGTSHGIFKTTDGGTTWSAVRTRWAGEPGGPLVVPALAIDPQNPDNVYAAGTYTGILKSTDAGASWATVNSDLKAGPAGLISLRIDSRNASTMYAGTNFGVFKTTDGGANWTAVNSGLPSDNNGRLTITNLLTDPQTPSTLYSVYRVTSAEEDCPLCGGDMFKSTDGGATWTAAVKGAALHATVLAIDPRNSRTLYAAGFGQGGHSAFKSTDGGASWTLSSYGLPAGPSGFPITVLAIDPLNPNTIFAGGLRFPGTGLFKTTDGGLRWSNAGLNNLFRLDSLAIDPQSTSTVYASALVVDQHGQNPQGQILKSTNGGISWTTVASFPSYFTALAVDPQNPRTVYAGTRTGVFRSTDGGANWNAVNSGLTTAITALAVDRQTPNTVYAGTAEGVFAISFVP